MNMVLGFIGELSPFHWLVVMVLGMLLFGKRLPEVGRYLGKGIVEFKKGLKGREDGDDDHVAAGPPAVRPDYPPLEAPRPPQRVVPPAPPAAPRFEDTAGSPQV